MALIRCPDCDRKVSDAAIVCPECARPIAALDGVGLRATSGEPEAPRLTRRARPALPAPPPRGEAAQTSASNVDRPPAATFAVTCSVCDAETILLYPRSAKDYVCPDCEEATMLRGGARQVVLQWLPFALGVVILLAVVAVIYFNIGIGARNPVLPHGD